MALSLTALPSLLPHLLHPSPCFISEPPGELKPSKYCFQRIRLVMSFLLVMGRFFLKGQPRSCLWKAEITGSIMLWVCTVSCMVVMGPNSPTSLGALEKSKETCPYNQLAVDAVPMGGECLPWGVTHNKNVSAVFKCCLCLENSGNDINLVWPLMLIGTNLNVPIQWLYICSCKHFYDSEVGVLCFWTLWSCLGCCCQWAFINQESQ